MPYFSNLIRCGFSQLVAHLWFVSLSSPVSTCKNLRVGRILVSNAVNEEERTIYYMEGIGT